MADPDSTLWREAVSRNPVLLGLGDETLRRLEAGGSEVGLGEGEILVEQGAEPQALFVVLAGRLEVAFHNPAGDRVTLNEVGAGTILGEIALLVGGKRSSTVRVLEDARVHRVPAEVVWELLDRDETLVARFNGLVQARLQRLQLATYVSGLFGALRREVLDEIEREVEWVSLPTGEVLFRQGDDPSDGIYIVAGGRVRVVVEEPGGSERMLAEIGRGESVGEMALLGDGLRSATVYAVRDSELARLSREAFERLMARYPTAMFQIARILVERLQHATHGPKGRRLGRSFAIVPISPDVPVREFAEQLAGALGPYEETLWIDAERLGAEIGRGDIAQLSEGDPGCIRLTQWLLEQEATHSVLLYVADREWSPWTRRAVRHADHVLYVGEAHAAPEPDALEQRTWEEWESGRVPRRSLVLLQAGGGRAFSGTAAWLEERSVDEYYHARPGNEDDFARLARLLTGRGIGLVLGGGGARGFAHIGVLFVLQELGVPIDAVGGTSMGALIGGLYALGHEPHTLTELCREHTQKLLDPTLPMVSLLGGYRTGRAFAEVFRSWSIEDLAVPYFCISTNLTRAAETVHRTGPLAHAVRASISLPGILPPVAHEGDLLIDGGLLNNIPVDAMTRVTGGGPMVAVDVSPDIDLRAEVDVGTEVSGWKVLWSRLSPFSERIPAPSILSVLGRSAVVGSILGQRQRLGHAEGELYLPLPVGEFSLLEFKAIDRIVAAGREAASEPLAAWLESIRPRSSARSRPESATT